MLKLKHTDRWRSAGRDIYYSAGKVIINNDLSVSGTAIIEFIESHSPVKLRDGLLLLRASDDAKEFHFFVSGEDTNTLGLSSAFDNTMIFATHDVVQNVNDMSVVFWDGKSSRPTLTLDQGGVGRANFFERSLIIGDGKGAKTLDESYTLGTPTYPNLSFDTAAYGADLGVEHDIQALGTIFASAMKVSGVDVLTSYTETDPVFIAWDKSTGIIITESQISDLQSYLTSETDPIFSAWDKSTGIEIYLSQVINVEEQAIPFESGFGSLTSSTLLNWDSVNNRLGVNKINPTSTIDVAGTVKATGMKVNGVNVLTSYTETDPVFLAWDKSTDIIITESQISDLSHTPAFDGNIAEIYNSAGDLKIMPDVQGNVVLFGDTDVGNAEDGKEIRIWRMAAEGNNYIRTYINSSENALIHSNTNILFQNASGKKIQFNSGQHIYLNLGDQAGNDEVRIRDNGGLEVGTIDSNGNAWFRGDVAIGVSSDVLIQANGDSYFNGGNVGIGRTPALKLDVAGSIRPTDTYTFPDGSTQIHGSTPDGRGWHVTTANFKQSKDISARDTSPRDIHFKPDGTKLYVVGVQGNSTVWEYDLTTPWDLSTLTYNSKYLDIDTYESNGTGLFFRHDGKKMYVCGAGGDEVNEFDLSTAWDVTSATWNQLYDCSPTETTPVGIEFRPDGLKMYIIGTQGDDVNEYDLSTAWDITTATWLQLFGTSIDNPTGLAFKPDGTKMYVMDGSAEDDIHEYNLSTPWDISTASLERLFDVSAENGVPQDIAFTPDGTKMYMLGSASPASMFEYDLGLIVRGTMKVDGALNHDGAFAGFYGKEPAAQPAHIVDADGTLADITTKFNQLMSDLALQGLRAAA